MKWYLSDLAHIVEAITAEAEPVFDVWLRFNFLWWILKPCILMVIAGEHKSLRINLTSEHLL